MTDQDLSASGQTYRIGAVSRLTGIPSDTLRVWERRYQVVAPQRSESGTRLYAAVDVNRLTLIKRLVDRGDAISSVARLSLEQLRERLRGSEPSAPPAASAGPCRVLVVGAALAERLGPVARHIEGIELIAAHGSREHLLESGLPSVVPDVVLVDSPTLHGDQIREFAELAARSGAARVILLYSFASRATLERLVTRRIEPRRAPIDPETLLRECLGSHARAPLDPPREPDVDLSAPIPPRRFADAELVRIAAASPTVRCECPHHLVDLVTALGAFEDYCAECEIRGSDDAALHAFLHVATAHARALMESALARVVVAEGISFAASGGEN